MALKRSNKNLIWIDLEMTGLDPEKERIIEIATIITDKGLNILEEGPNLVIHQPKELLAAMDDWNTNQHKESGLLAKVKSLKKDFISFRKKYTEFKKKKPHLQRSKDKKDFKSNEKTYFI